MASVTEISLDRKRMRTLWTMVVDVVIDVVLVVVNGG